MKSWRYHDIILSLSEFSENCFSGCYTYGTSVNEICWNKQRVS